jgi:hypothetical protein
MLYNSYFIMEMSFIAFILFIRYICMLMLDIGEHLFVDAGFSYALRPM